MRRPSFEDERAVADEVAGPRPRRTARVQPAELLDCSPMHRQQPIVGCQYRQIGHRVVEFENERVFVAGPQADLVKISESSDVKFLCALDTKQQVGPIGAERRRKEATQLCALMRVLFRPSTLSRFPRLKWFSEIRK